MHLKWFSIWQLWEKTKTARQVKEKQVNSNEKLSGSETGLLHWLREND